MELGTKGKEFVELFFCDFLMHNEDQVEVDNLIWHSYDRIIKLKGIGQRHYYDTHVYPVCAEVAKYRFESSYFKDIYKYARKEYCYLISENVPLQNFYIKIGVSSDVEKRFKAIQMMNPRELSILKTIPSYCAYIVERYLHLVFSKYRMHGEWFNLDDDAQEELFYLVNNYKKNIGL